MAPHLNCTGESRSSRPTVILEAGIGDFSVEWSLVQPGVAGFARVCSSDRAGDGWSDLGPHPRTMHQIVSELHALLDQAGERPPYVLVGHSYGGWLVRLYQSTYESDVVGMVLVEGGADNPWRMLPSGKLVRAAELATGKPIAPVQTSNPLREADIPPVAMSQIRAGLADASLHANDPPRDRLPLAARQMRTWALGTVKHVAAAVNPFEIEELAGLAARSAQTDHPLGDLPLVVLTRGLPEETGPGGTAREEEHRKDHVLLAAFSRNGKLVVAAHSGHHVQIQEPELVVNAVREVVTAAGK